MRKTVSYTTQHDDFGHSKKVLECIWRHKIEAAGIIVPIETVKIIEIGNIDYDFEKLREQDENISKILMQRADNIRELLKFLESLGFNQKS